MKRSRGILALLLILAFSASSVFAANTIVLRSGSNNTTEATLQDALAAAVQGDTIDITAYDTPIDGGGGFQLLGVSLICSAQTPATINFSVAQDPSIYANMTYMLTQGTVTLSNINFVGCNNAGAAGVIAFDNITIDKCSFSNFTAAGMWILNVDAFNAAGKGMISGKLNANITNTYSVGNGSAIQVSSVAVASQPVQSCTINIDHCTLANKYNPLFFDTTYLNGEPTHDFTPLHMTNTLLYSDPAMAGPGIFVQDAGASAGVTPAAINWSEDHNAFIGVTEPSTAIISYQIASPGTQTALAKSDIYEPWPASNPFTDSANGNYTLNAIADVRGKASDGSNIGADQSPLPDTVIVMSNADQSTSTVYTDLATAAAHMAPGYTLDIRKAVGPMLWGPNGTAVPGAPSWCTIKCSAATPATILIPTGNGGNNMFCALDHMTLQNLIIDGQCTADQHDGAASLCNGGIASTITDCTFKGAWWTLIYYSAGTMTDGVQDPGVTFTNCYFISGAGSCISFTNQWITAPATITNKAIIDHCTFIGIKDGPSMEVDPSYAGQNLKDIFTLRNSILSGRQTAVGINYHVDSTGNAILTDPANQVDEDYNLYDAWWNPLYAEGGNGADPVGAHSIKWDYRNIDATHPDIFKDYTNGDYTLNPKSGNPCLGSAENGTDMGVYHAPVVPNAAKSWTLFN